MRWVRASALVAALAGASRGVGSLLLDPLVETVHLLTAPPGYAAAATGSAALPTAIAGFSAALLLLAWAWLVAAVSTCAWATLRSGPSGGAARAASAFRPRVVRAVVTTVLGTGALAAPTAHAHPATAHDAPPDAPVAAPGAAAPPERGQALLAGLPAPDRVAGAGPRPVGRCTPQRAGRAVLVRPGDSLWTLTAALLPAEASAATVARGWRLLYAANRHVVGSDPDLLRPGQSLRLGTALLEVVRCSHRSSDPAPARPC